MEEVVSSNLTRSTKTFQRLTLTPNYQSYVQLKSGTAPHVDLAEWRLPHRAAQLARWHRRSEIEDQEAPAYVGYLVERYRLQAAAERAHPEKWVFTLTDGSALPLWASGVRQALKRAAAAEGCDFPGLGPHSFRRANITWRQEEGASSIEASKIAGHSAHDGGIHEDPTRPAGRTHAPGSRALGQRGSEATSRAAIKWTPGKRPAHRAQCSAQGMIASWNAPGGNIPGDSAVGAGALWVQAGDLLDCALQGNLWSARSRGAQPAG